jgi:hypothetical protein
MKSLYGTAVPKANPSTGFPRQRIPARGGARGRFNAYGRLTPTQAPSGIIVAGRKLLRVAGPIAFFVDLFHPDMLGNATASAFRMMNNPDFVNPPKGFSRVDTAQGRWIVPNHDPAIPRGIEKGLWGIAPDAPPIGIPASVGLSRTDAALAEALSWSGATRSLDATQAMLQGKFADFQTSLRVLQKRNLDQLGLILGKIEQAPEFAYEPGAPIGMVQPNPHNFMTLKNTGNVGGLPHIEWVFDDFGYRAAMQSYRASVAAIQRQQELDYQKHVRRYNEDVERIERVHATVRRNNAVYDLEISHQTQQMASNFRYAKRKNDRKTKGGLYRAWLRVINQTYGKADEAADLAKAWLYNLHPVGTPENMAGWRPVYWNGQRELIPSTFLQAAIMFTDGRADLDWAGFAKSVVHNQAIDYLYGQLGKTPQLDALTDSYGGIHSGPAL